MYRNTIVGFGVLALFIIGCSAKESKQEELVDQKTDPILTSYFDIVSALTNDDFKAVQKAGMELYKVEASAGPKLALVNMGRLIVEATSRLEQQKVLYQMGVVMPLFLEENSLHDYTIFKFRCTKVLDGKEGVWFSKTKESYNPFLDKKSTDCTELIETISPVKQILE